MQQLIDFIEARHALMLEIDQFLKSLLLVDESTRQFFKLRPIHFTLEQKLEYRKSVDFLLKEYISKFQSLCEHFSRIPDSDFNTLFAIHPLSQQLQLTSTFEHYFCFFPLQGQYLRDSFRCYRLFNYYIAFLIVKSPALMQKAFQRLASKNIFKSQKMHLVASSNFKFSSRVSALYMPANLESQMNDLSFSLALDCNSYVFIPGEISFFHEFVHMVHYLTGRWLRPATPEAHTKIHELRPLSDEKQKRYEYRYAEFLSKKVLFGNEDSDTLYEEFHTIHGGTHAIGEGLNENALRYALRLRLRYSHFGGRLTDFM